MRTSALALSLLLYAFPSAAEPGELRFAAGPTFGTEFRSDRKDGLGIEAMADYGLTDLLAFTAGGGYASHFLGSGARYQFAHAGFGLIANLDVLIVVPFLSLRAGWLWFGDEAESSSGIGLAIGAGADYMWTERLTVGVFCEYHGMLSDIDRFPRYLAIGLRAGYRRLH